MRQIIFSSAIFLTLALTFLLFVSYQQHGKESPVDGSGKVASNLPQVIRSIDISKAYTFAGEEVPIHNFDARERLDRELSVNSYWHSSTMLNIKQANRYFPVIEPILKRYDIPGDFKFVAVVESNLRNVTSPAGAKGFWQFVKRTGEHYGLEINGDVDERYHLEKSTEAACRYLKEYYGDFGSWTLAAAAYNMGGPSLKRALEEQKAESYYELNLSDETSRYVFRILAIKELLSSPEDYGFYVEQGHLYAPLAYRTVTVDTSVSSWGDFARQHGTTYRLLKVHNPWLISSSLSNKSGKEYEIKLPAEG